MAQPPPLQTQSPSDVRVVEIDNRTFILVGTAHISRQSAELVREVIEAEQPDHVCVELDERRYKALAERKKWESLDLKALIRQKQLSTLLINVLLAAYQKKLGDKLGTTPGLELLEATQVAREHDIPFSLCDRDVRITLRRAWNSMSFGEKFKLMVSGLAGLFEDSDLSEEDLSEIRQKDVLTELMTELGRAMPAMKSVLLDERDVYLAQKIREAEGQKIVAVVGAGHVNGIAETLEQNVDQDLDALEQIPPASSVWKWIGWGIPALILGSLAYIGWSKGAEAAGENAMFWFLANGIPSALGALVALAHPLTIGAAFLCAPFTSLTPVIGAGYVAAFVQAYVHPPVVREFEHVSSDVSVFSQWWKNKLLRVLLVFILTSLGSVIGTYVGAYEIVSNLF